MPEVLPKMGERCSKQRTETRGAPVARKRWLPKRLLPGSSPHPRACQEQRFETLAKEWHPCVTVPQYIAGFPTTTEMLHSGVFLPTKHCFWKGCQWVGESNEERWRHIREMHWSATLEQATDYYHYLLHENLRLETVLNQIASTFVRKGAPFACKAIDRRCLFGLYRALEAEDSVQSLICFVCACSHPLVTPLRNCKIAYHSAFQGTSFLGLSRCKVEELLGLRTFLEKFGHRTWDGAVTDLSSSPFAKELDDWEISVWLLQRNVALLCCPEDVS